MEAHVYPGPLNKFFQGNLVAKKENDNENKKKAPKETASESIASFAATFVAGLFIITFIMQLFNIPSSSMEDTLLVGDYVWVDRLTPTAKASYVGPLMPYREVHRGDIIVFLKPNQPGLHLVKRIVGLPGDRIHLEKGILYRNGERLNEPYIKHVSGDYLGYRDEFPSQPLPYGVDPNRPDWPWPLEVHQYVQGSDLVIPPDSYFGMGDNRDNSLDSRFWGFIPRASVVGRPLFVFWSLDIPPTSETNPTASQRAHDIGYAIRHFFDKTRWRRTFHLVH
jgi:signal peptidase I